MPHPKTNVLVTVAEVTVVALLGLMAGFFFAFAVDVAPAMAQLDGPTYVTVQQLINSTVRNALFGSVYFGSMLAPFIAALACFVTAKKRRAVGWLVLALVYFAAVFWLTRSVNVPINNELAGWSASSPPASWTAARDAWNESNLVRAWASALCFFASLALIALRTRGRPAA